MAAIIGRIFMFCVWVGVSKAPSDEGAAAKLTEGETLDSQINRFAYTAKIAVNIQIANSHYR